MSTLVYLHNYEIVLSGLTPLGRNIPITTDFNEFQTSNATLKIAIVEFDYINGGYVSRPTIDLLADLAFADLVIFRSIEGNPVIEAIIKNSDRANCIFFLAYVSAVELKHATVVHDMYWLKSTASFYIDGSATFNIGVDSYTQKDIAFEVMYGVEKPHRRFVKDYINANPNFLESKFLNRSSVYNDSYGDTDDIFWEDNIIRDDEADMIIHKGNHMLASQVIPTKVYNKTAYSIICETDFRFQYVFPTEKVAKPMIAGRLFIVIGGQNYLQGLRELGFKTFNGVIDESYDSIEDDQLRWEAAMDEAMKLTQRPQAEIFEQCSTIFRHNQEQLIKMQYPYFTLERYLEEFINRASYAQV